jgi:predicted aspartyl protease
VRNAARKRRRDPRIAGSYRAGRTAAIGACLALAATIAAASPPDPRELLAAVHAALSPGADVASVRALRVETVIEMGGEPVGRVEKLGRREPRAYLEVLELAGVRRKMTVLGDHVWMTDPNGAVRAATGEELVDAVVAHALLFHAYLDGSSRDLTVALREGDDRTLELRNAHDENGPPRTLTIADPEEMLLPGTFRQRQHGIEIVTTFEDWREVDGIRFPFLSKQSTGDPRFDLTLRTVACNVLDELPPGAITAPEAGPRDFEFTDRDSASAIRVDLAAGLVLVTAEVDGTAGSFLVDTGAGATVLDAAFAESLGLSQRGVMEARGAGGSEAAAFVDVETLRLPGVVLRGQTVVTLPLDGVAAALRRPLAGILGYDFLSRFAVEIDWPRATLGLVPSGEYRPAEDAVHVPLRVEMNVPRVEGVLDREHRGSFLLDTGNSRSLLLHSPFVRTHGYDGHPSRIAADVTGVGGSTAMRSIAVGSLSIGRVEFLDVDAFFSDSDEGIVAIDEAIGNIGAALFRAGAVAFDYSEESLWIRSPSSASASSR